MTAHATIAREVALQFEAKLDALRRNQDGTVKLTLTVNPNDFPMQLMTDPLGQRYVCVMVAVQADETPKVSAPCQAGKAPEGSHPPVAGKERWEEMSYAKRAGILSNDPDFHAFVARQNPARWLGLLSSEKSAEGAAALLIRAECGVTSRADIDKSAEARDAFNRMFTAYDVERKYGAM